MTHEDDFLYQFRQEPRPEFVRQIRARFNGPKRTSSARMQTSLRLAASAALTCMFAAVILLVSPEARAQVAEFVDGIKFTYFDDVTVRTIPRTRGPGASQVTIVPNDQLSIQEAQAVYRFQLPTWMPENYEARPFIKVFYYSEREIGMDYRWFSSDSSQLILSIFNNSTPQPVIGPNSDLHEIRIGEETGAAWVGSWTDGEFGGNKRVIVWAEDDVSYYLSAYMLTEDELIRIAESFEYPE